LRINRFISSLRWKTILAFVVLIVVGLFLLEASVIQLIENFLVEQRIKEQQLIAEDLAVDLAPYLEKADAVSLYNAAVDYGKNEGGRMLILNAQGVVQVDGFSQLNGQRLNQQAVEEVISGQSYSAYGFQKNRTRPEEGSSLLTRSGTVTSWTMYYTTAIIYNGQRLGALVLSVSIQDVVDQIDRIYDRMMLYGVIITLAVVVVSIFITGWITNPIKQLTQRIREMAQGNYHQRMKVTGHNEISHLSESFNQMSERIETMEKLRNEFVSSASHELKTPLASMKILVESIIHQGITDPEMVKEFLGDVDLEIDRLNNIINDLLTLVQVDKQSLVLHKSAFPLQELIIRTMKVLNPIAEQKKIQLAFDIREGVYVDGDMAKLQQVLMNLVDNALKYTPEGGQVVVTLLRKDNYARILVADTGIGIPEADLPHIFERFYRVDKARSRSTGGTGLGLAIVKQIVEMHDGIITVSSKEGEGSLITVDLPSVEPPEELQQEEVQP
jgi:two-component system OmpR family sensor kinase